MAREKLIPIRVSDLEYCQLAKAARAASSRGISTFIRAESIFIVNNQRSIFTNAKREALQRLSWEISRISTQLLFENTNRSLGNSEKLEEIVDQLDAISKLSTLLQTQVSELKVWK